VVENWIDAEEEEEEREDKAIDTNVPFE